MIEGDRVLLRVASALLLDGVGLGRWGARFFCIGKRESSTQHVRLYQPLIAPLSAKDHGVADSLLRPLRAFVQQLINHRSTDESELTAQIVVVDRENDSSHMTQRRCKGFANGLTALDRALGTEHDYTLWRI